MVSRKNVSSKPSVSLLAPTSFYFPTILSAESHHETLLKLRGLIDSDKGIANPGFAGLRNRSRTRWEMGVRGDSTSEG